MKLSIRWSGVWLYRSSETWSVHWHGLRWKWLPGFGPGMGCKGWTWHWGWIMAERFCFDDDDWGEQKARDLGDLFSVLKDDA